MRDSKTSRPSLKDMFQKFDEEQAKLEQEMWGAQSPHSSLSQSPKFQAIVAILHEQPILVEPTLNWLNDKRAAFARQQLALLYTPEQLEQMFAEAKQ